MGLDGQRHVPATIRQEKSRYPLKRKLAGTQERFGRGGNFAPPPGLNLRTVQPIASRCTNYGIRIHVNEILILNFKLFATNLLYFLPVALCSNF